MKCVALVRLLPSPSEWAWRYVSVSLQRDWRITHVNKRATWRFLSRLLWRGVATSHRVWATYQSVNNNIQLLPSLTPKPEGQQPPWLDDDYSRHCVCKCFWKGNIVWCDTGKLDTETKNDWWKAKSAQGCWALQESSTRGKFTDIERGKLPTKCRWTQEYRSFLTSAPVGLLPSQA